MDTVALPGMTADHLEISRRLKLLLLRGAEPFVKKAQTTRFADFFTNSYSLTPSSKPPSKIEQRTP